MQIAKKDANESNGRNATTFPVIRHGFVIFEAFSYEYALWFLNKWQYQVTEFKMPNFSLSE